MSKNDLFGIIVAAVAIVLTVSVGLYLGNKGAAANQQEYTDRYNTCIEAGNTPADCASAEALSRMLS